MAKGKHAALFEVIHKDKRFAKASLDQSGALRPPRWWFRRNRPTAAPPPPAREAAPPPAPSGPGRSLASRLMLNPHQKQVEFRLSYSALAIWGVSLLMVVTIAYLIGHSMAKGPRPVLARQTTTELQAGPADPSVLEVNEDVPGGGNPAATEPVAAAVQGSKPTFNEPRPPATFVVDDAQRTIGLNYVIMQTYPDKQSAEEARDVLVRAGVPCTVEPGPVGYARMDWYSVVGIKGFGRSYSNTPEYKAYIRKIEQVNKEFAGSKFKQFDPRAYKWRESR
jgi:hypothetical protein